MSEVFKDFGLLHLCFPGEKPGQVRTIVALDGPIEAHVIEEHPDLELLVVDDEEAVDLGLCRARDVVVCAISATAPDSAAELAVGLMLASLRRIPALDAGCREGRWGAWPGGRLGGRCVGIVGTGAEGQRLAALLQPFGVTLLGYSRRPRPDFPGTYVDWTQIWARCSVVSLHLPLNGATRGIVGLRELERLGVGALLVNVSSPHLVQLEVLLNVLETGRLGQAALDLPDPLRREHPLTALSQVILTPGVASRTTDALEARLREVARAVALGREGRHPNPIT